MTSDLITLVFETLSSYRYDVHQWNAANQRTQFANIRPENTTWLETAIDRVCWPSEALWGSMFNKRENLKYIRVEYYYSRMCKHGQEETERHHSCADQARGLSGGVQDESN